MLKLEWHAHCCSATLFGMYGLYQSQVKADIYALSMGRRVAGKASSRFNWTTFDGLAVLRRGAQLEGAGA